jgi:hypothetical protein
VLWALTKLLPAPAFWLTSFPRQKSSPSGDLVLKRLSSRAQGRRAPFRERTCRPRPRGKARWCGRAARRRRRKLAAASDAVLVAHHFLKLGAHLITALAHLHERILARRFDWIRFAANYKIFSMAVPFWYFWLTIQNTADRQVRNLFCLS